MASILKEVLSSRMLGNLCRLPCVVVVLACSGAASDSRSKSAADSALAPAVASPAPLWKTNERWLVEAQPVLEVGVDEGDPMLEFETILGLTRLANGNIVVGNRGTRELRFFTSAGQFIRGVGGDGEGPGEFRNFNGVYPYRRDSLIVWDYRLKRWSVFDTAGAFARIIRPVRPGLNPRSLAPLDDGSLIMTDYSPKPQLASLEEMQFFRFGPDGALMDSLGTYPSSETFRPANGDNIAMTRIFGPRLVRTAGPDGFFIGLGTDYEVIEYSTRGQPRRRIRWTGPDRTVSKADVDAYRTDFIERQNRSGALGQQFARFVTEVPAADRFPAYSEMLRDRAGNLWLAGYRRPRQSTAVAWTVLSSHGRWLGDVELPAGLEIWDIGDTYVLGVFQDELDVERVRMHRIRKPSQ